MCHMGKHGQVKKVPPETLAASNMVTLMLEPNGVINEVIGSLWNIFHYTGPELDEQPFSSLVDVVDRRLVRGPLAHPPDAPDVPYREQLGVLGETRLGRGQGRGTCPGLGPLASLRPARSCSLARLLISHGRPGWCCPRPRPSPPAVGMCPPGPRGSSASRRCTSASTTRSNAFANFSWV